MSTTLAQPEVRHWLWAIGPRLQTFLKDNKRTLVLQGVKFKHDNVPTDPDDVIAFVATLPPRAIPTLHSWLTKTAPTNLPAASDALSALRDAIANGVALDYEEHQSTYYSALLAATNASVAPELTAFLSSPKFADVQQDVLQPLQQVTAVEAPSATQSAPVSQPLHFDEDTDSILGYCKNVVGGGGAFAEVLAVQSQGKWTPIRSTAERRALFPSSGDVFVGSRDKSLAIGDFGYWKLEQQSGGDHKSAFRTKGVMGPVYSIKQLQSPSTDPDGVREQLRALPQSHQRLLFRLADGLILRLKAIANPLTYDFSEAADAWSSLTPLHTPHGDVVCGQLPPPDLKYDCAELGVSIKRLFQEAGSLKGFPRFSKAELGELIKHINEHPDSGLTTESAKRTLVGLGSVLEQRDSLDFLTAELLKHPKVAAAISERVQSLAQTQAAAKSDLARAVAELEEKKKQLTKQIDVLKGKVDETGQKVMKAAKRAFDRAVRDGEETLAQSAVFAALVGSKNSGAQVGAAGPAQFREPALIERPVRRNEQPLDAALRKVLPARTADGMSQAIAVASQTGALIAFGGQGSSKVARLVSEVMLRGEGVFFDIIPGLVDHTALSAVIGDVDRLDVICLLRANSSATDAYATGLEDLLWDRLSADQGSTRPLIIASLVDGPTALPLSAGLRAVTLEFDTDDAPRSDVGTTAENWLVEVRDSWDEQSRRPPAILTQIIARIAASLNANTSQEALAMLKAAAIRSSAADESAL